MALRSRFRNLGRNEVTKNRTGNPGDEALLPSIAMLPVTVAMVPDELSCHIGVSGNPELSHVGIVRMVSAGLAEFVFEDDEGDRVRGQAQVRLYFRQDDFLDMARRVLAESMREAR